MPVAHPNQAETYLLACTSIVRDLIEVVSDPDNKKEINLNALRKQYGKKYKMKGVPRLVDILSAVPEEWRDRLRGALRAKPVRTASGVSPFFVPQRSLRRLIV
jgi:elongator complex protein 3